MYKGAYRTDSGLLDTVVAAAFSLILFLGRLGDGGLRSDSLLYSAVSKSVLSSDNPLVLHLGNEIYLNKPPLFFWINSFFIKLFGTGVFSAKFASALGAAMLSMLIFKIAKDIFKSTGAGYMAMFFFCANLIIFRNSHACRPESIMTLFLVAGFYFAAKYSDHAGISNIVLSAVFFGLTVLIKGYIGGLAFICAVLVILFSRKSIGTAKTLFGIIVSIVFFIGAFGWWYYYAVKNTDFLNVFFFLQTMDRFSDTGMFTYQAPAYQYLTKFIIASVIMLPFLLIGLKNILTCLKESSLITMYTLFSVIYIAGIHFSATKYDRYTYPVIPLLCVISAYGFITVLRLNLRRAVIFVTFLMAVFYCFYPGSLGDKEYNGITSLEKTAALNGGSLCADKGYESYWEHKAALVFFADSYKSGNCSENDILISSPDARCGGYLLQKTGRFSACAGSHK